jgi:hypothetical protein
VGPSAFGMLTSGWVWLGGSSHPLAPPGQRMDGWMSAIGIDSAQLAHLKGEAVKSEDSSSSMHCERRLGRQSSDYIHEVEVVFYENCRR